MLTAIVLIPVMASRSALSGAAAARSSERNARTKSTGGADGGAAISRRSAMPSASLHCTSSTKTTTGPRAQSIAKGSGSSVTEVNDLLQRFNQMRKMMKNAGKMKKMMAQMARMKN